MDVAHGAILGSKVEWYDDALVLDAAHREPVSELGDPGSELCHCDAVWSHSLHHALVEQRSQHRVLAHLRAEERRD